jgi:hypothetical protein
MARSHTMTPARRAALRKAQIASAAKRRGKHFGNVSQARFNRNRARQKAGFSYSTRKNINSQFEAAVNHSRVHTLGKKPRSQRNQTVRRVARVAGKHAVITTGVGLQVAASFPNSRATKKIDRGLTRGYYKGKRYGRMAKFGASAAKRSPHMAKEFAKGAKTGYSNRRAGQRNMSRMNFNHAHAERVGPLALTAGTGANFHGRRVRGY